MNIIGSHILEVDQGYQPITANYNMYISDKNLYISTMKYIHRGH